MHSNYASIPTPSRRLPFVIAIVYVKHTLTGLVLSLIPLYAGSNVS